MPISQTISLASSFCKILARISHECRMVSPVPISLTALRQCLSNVTQLTFQEVIETSIAWNFELWSDTQSRTAGLGDRDGFHDPLIVALAASAAVHGIIVI